MKKTILLTLTLIISYCGSSQENNARFILSKDSAFIDNFSWLQVNPRQSNNPIKNYYQITINGILKVSGNRDTLEIKSREIKFIKVDGKTYEIKRTTELKEVVDNYGYFGKLRLTPYIHTDTVTWITPKIKKQ